MSTPDAEVHVLEPYRAKRVTFYSATTRDPQSSDRQATSRLAAIAADASSTDSINLSLMWRELVRGTSKVVDTFFAKSRGYLLLSRRAEELATPIEGRRLEILEAVLGGLRQKNIAIDMRLAPSTVALNSRLALESIGLNCKPSRAHPILMLAAKSATRMELTLASCATFVSDGRELRVIGLPRPDRLLQQTLPPAELAVIRLLVEGLSYEEIAQIRGTAMRTIANQITAVFRRLQVSGRNELVQRLFLDDAASQPRTNAETLAPPDSVRTTSAVALEGARRSA